MVRIGGNWFKLSPTGRVSTKAVGAQNRKGGINHVNAFVLLKEKRTLQSYCKEQSGKIIWYRYDAEQLLGGVYLSNLFFTIEVDENDSSVKVSTVINLIECIAREGKYGTLRENIVYAISSMKECVEKAKEGVYDGNKE